MAQTLTLRYSMCKRVAAISWNRPAVSINHGGRRVETAAAARIDPTTRSLRV